MPRATAALLIASVSWAVACGRVSNGLTESAKGDEAPRSIGSAAGALECASQALGKPNALSQVSTVSVRLESRPGPEIRGGVPSTAEITVGLPARFKRVLRSERPMGRPPAIRVDGLSDRLSFGGYTDTNGDMVPTNAPAESQKGTQHDFARYALAWLLRSTGSVPLRFSHGGYETFKEERQVVVHASGSDGFEATLYIREADCVPSALAFQRPATMGDSLRDQAAGRTPTSKMRTEFLYMTRHEPFKAILFPTELRREVDGLVVAAMKVTDVQIDPILPPDFFSFASGN
jgi:hypothetical protein